MTSDPAHDFDFIYGSWRISHHKLRDNTDPDCDDWVDFEGTGEAFPVLDGVGHVDRIIVTESPDGSPWQGMTLRLFDPADAIWRIWWSSTRAPGRLDPPMSGTFVDGHGVFFGDDVIDRRPVRLRFDWHADADAPRWEQAFSFDAGATWVPNWVMRFRRTE